MATETLTIVIQERGGARVIKTIDRVGRSAKGAAVGVGTLGTAFTLIGVGLVAREFIRLSDSFTNIQNRLKTVTSSTEELRATQEALLGVANRTRQDFESVVQIFARTRRATEDMGLSAKETIEFTESLGQAVALSGASAVESSNALRQLSQSFASGALRGDELRSISEQLPVILDVIAEQTGKTRSEIIKMGKEGKISAKLIIDSFRGAREELSERFAKFVPTIGQAFVVLKNELLIFVGGLNETLGIADKVTQGILFVARNFDTFGKIIKIVARVIVSLLIRKALFGAVRAFQVLFAIMATNPFGALLVIFAALIGAMIEFGDKIKISATNTATLRDLMFLLGRAIVEVVKASIKAMKRFAEAVAFFFGQTFKGIELNLENVLIFVAIFIGKARLAFLFMAFSVTSGFAIIFKAVIASLAQLGSFILIAFEAVINKAIGAINVVREAIPGVKKFGKVSLGSDFLGNASRKLRDSIGDIAKTQQGLQEDLLSDTLDPFTKRFVEGVKSLLAGVKASTDKIKDFTFAVPGDGDDADDDEKQKNKIKSIANEFDNLLGQLNPVIAAQQKLASSTLTLDQAFDAGLITLERRNNLVAKQKDQLDAALTPFDETILKLKQEIKLLQLSADERERNLKLIELENKIRNAGEDTSDKQRQQLFDLILQKERIKFENEAILKQEKELVKVVKEQSETAKILGDILTTTFTSAGEALIKFTREGRGEFESLGAAFRNLADSILQDIQRILLRKLVTRAVGGIIGGGAGFAHGGSFNVGGSGGPDSQLVAFRASPSERVDILTPGQQAAQGQSGGGGAPQAISIINVGNDAEAAAMSAIESARGRKVILNTLGDNSDQVRRLLTAR